MEAIGSRRVPSTPETQLAPFPVNKVPSQSEYFFRQFLRLRIKSHLPHRRARKTQRDNSPKDSSPKDNYNNSNPAASSASETRTLFLFYFVIKLQMKCQIKTSAVDLNVVLSRDSNPGPQDGRAQIH